MRDIYIYTQSVHLIRSRFIKTEKDFTCSSSKRPLIYRQEWFNTHQAKAIVWEIDLWTFGGIASQESNESGRFDKWRRDEHLKQDFGENFIYRMKQIEIPQNEIEKFLIEKGMKFLHKLL